MEELIVTTQCLILTLSHTHTHTPAAAEFVYIWGGSGGQKDNYIHTHKRFHNMGYAIKTMEMYQSSELVDHFVI